MSKASLRGFCQHLPRLRVLLGRVDRARPRWGGVCTRIGFYEKNKKNKSLLNLQTGGGWGAWFLFARAFMGRECAHLIRARRLLCFGLAFALACAGLCESISLCWLELRSMPRHRCTASELMPHRLQEEKPNATAAKKQKNSACGLTDLQSVWLPGVAACLLQPHRVAVPASCSRRSTLCPSTFAAEVGHPSHQGDPQRAPHVQGGAAASQNGAHHREQEQLAGPAHRGAAGEAGHRPRGAGRPPQAAVRRLDDGGGHRHVQPAEDAGGAGQYTGG